MAILLFLSSIPGNLDPENLMGKAFIRVAPTWQNLLHVPLYAGLTLSWLWALLPSMPSRRWRLASAFTFSTIWALVDENYQLSIPGRYGSFTDVLLNLLGISLAVLYYRHISRPKNFHS